MCQLAPVWTMWYHRRAEYDNVSVTSIHIICTPKMPASSLTGLATRLTVVRFLIYRHTGSLLLDPLAVCVGRMPPVPLYCSQCWWLIHFFKASSLFGVLIWLTVLCDDNLQHQSVRISITVSTASVVSYLTSNLLITYKTCNFVELLLNKHVSENLKLYYCCLIVG